LRANATATWIDILLTQQQNASKIARLGVSSAKIRTFEDELLKSRPKMGSHLILFATQAPLAVTLILLVIYPKTPALFKIRTLITIQIITPEMGLACTMDAMYLAGADTHLNNNATPRQTKKSTSCAINRIIT
jgi:hypothetical protein